MNSDFDSAFRLQTEEPIATSLCLQPSSSSSAPVSSCEQRSSPKFGVVVKCHKVDKEMSGSKARRTSRDRTRRCIHDDNFVQYLSRSPCMDWESYGDQVRMPSGEGLVNFETCSRIGEINADRCDQSVRVICSEPRVSIYPNFLSIEECEHIIDLAKPHMERSLVRDGFTGKYSVDDRRTSSGALIKRGQDKIITDIENRISEWTSIPASHGENPYVLHYKVGEKFEEHHDYFIDEENMQNGGQRIVTVLMYLSNVEEGGETIFPDAKWNKGAGHYWDILPTYGKKGLSVKPKMGDAVLFWNVKPNGFLDPLSLHAGCPLIQGNKWACTKWLRANEFKI